MTSAVAFARTRYQIESSLGKGGMGEVFLARDTLLERTVALKVLTYANEPDPQAAAKQLLREARLGAALKHPNIVTTHDLGEENGTAFIVMELIEGQSLRALLVGIPLPASKTTKVKKKLKWLMEVASALDAAHKQGLVHRDIKPENVMITTDGIAKVLDFGIAKFHGLRDIPMSSESLGLQAPVTISGVMGTPRYMAPEQWAGIADARSDQYAWGLVAYEVISGEHPKHVDGRPRNDRRPLTEFGVTSAVGDVIERAMEQDPTKRHVSLADVVRALEVATKRAGGNAFAKEEDTMILDTAAPPATRSVDEVDEQHVLSTALSPAGGRPTPPPPTTPLHGREAGGTLASPGLSPATVKLELPSSTVSITGSVLTPPPLSREQAQAQAQTQKNKQLIGGKTALAIVALLGVLLASGLVLRHRASTKAIADDDATSATITTTTTVPDPATTTTSSTTSSSSSSSSSPSPSPSPSPSSSTPVVAAPSVVVVATRKPAPAPKPAVMRPNCKVPYTINAEGVHIPKPECL